MSLAFFYLRRHRPSLAWVVPTLMTIVLYTELRSKTNSGHVASKLQKFYATDGIKSKHAIDGATYSCSVGRTVASGSLGHATPSSGQKNKTKASWVT